MKFEDFNFHPDVMAGVRDMRYASPTPIQEKSIPPAMEGRDLIANAQTGSGKTAAFLLPLMHRAVTRPPGKTRILVLAPTRELACQIDDQALGFGYHTELKSSCIYGGVKMEMQEQVLLAGTSIIVATPGRLLDHHKYGNWRFDDLDAFVLDEADRMLDMGFWPDIQNIIKHLPVKKQMLLFSATMPDPIVKMAKQIMHDPEHIKIGLVKPPSSISQFFYPVNHSDKERLLLHLIKEHDMTSTIIFMSTKIGAEKLYRSLKKNKFSVGVIHGDRDQKHRDEVMSDFRGGKLKMLVATDVAARGIDIGGISHVVNVDIPNDTDSYIHRIGRTARADSIGDAFTFITVDDEEKVADIEKAIEKKIPRKVVEGFKVTDSARTYGNSRGGGPRSGGSGPRKPFRGKSDGTRQGSGSSQGHARKSSSNSSKSSSEGAGRRSGSRGRSSGRRFR